MAYAPFKIRKSDLPLATLATFATVEPQCARTVANVASVARGVRENDVSTSPSVANVASVAGHIPKTENSAPVAIAPVAEPETPEAAVASRLDAMAAENDRRRDWTKVSPYEPDDSLVMRSALTGDGVTIYLPKGRTRH